MKLAMAANDCLINHFKSINRSPKRMRPDKFISLFISFILASSLTVSGAERKLSTNPDRQMHSVRQTNPIPGSCVCELWGGQKAALVVPGFSVFIWLSDAEEKALRCRADFLKTETQRTHWHDGHKNCIDTKEHCLISKRQRKITYDSELTLCYYSSTKPDNKAFNPIIDLLDLGFRGK